MWQYFVAQLLILITTPFFDLHYSHRETYTWAHKVMMSVFLAGFVMISLYIFQDVMVTLTTLKFGLEVSLPGGLTAQAQEAAINSQAAAYNFILEDWCTNLLVNA